MWAFGRHPHLTSHELSHPPLTHPIYCTGTQGKKKTLYISLFGTHYAYLPAPTSASIKIRKKGENQNIIEKKLHQKVYFGRYMFPMRSISIHVTLGHDMKNCSDQFHAWVFYPGFVSRPRGEVGGYAGIHPGVVRCSPPGGGVLGDPENRGSEKNLTTKKNRKKSVRGLPFWASWFFKHVVNFHICPPSLGHTWGVPVFFFYLYYFIFPPPSFWNCGLSKTLP